MAALGTLARGGRREDIANDVWGEGGTKIAAIRVGVYVTDGRRYPTVRKRLKLSGGVWSLVQEHATNHTPSVRSRTSLVNHGVDKQLTRRLYRQIL